MCTRISVVGTFAVAVAVSVAGSLPEPAWAQRASANLLPVESGKIDTRSETEVEKREMCLRAGLYVLAFIRGSGQGDGAAVVGTGNLNTEEIINGVMLSASDQDGWGWVFFNVLDDNTCLQLAAVHGRARVYQVRVRVDW